MSKAALEIRAVREEDRELFLRLSEEFYSSEAVLHSVPAKNHKDCFEELMGNGAYARCCMLFSGEACAGYALLALSYSREAGGLCVWLEELYICPEHRGRGFGREFLRWLEENVPAARYRLELEPDNRRAEKLYSSLGYRRLGYRQMVKGE